jgi:L-ascorbate metabolism protein UlaG (beta-lactamase superfamily)
MEIVYHGANCFSISTKKAQVVVDDNLESHGAKSVTKPDSICLFSEAQSRDIDGAKLVISQPGEYEVSDISVIGVPARLHIDEPDKQTGTVYKIIAELTETQLEALGTVDVLVIPVGGGGLTMDGLGALKIVKKIEPKLIIPVHYEQKGISYEVPQQALENSLKDMSMEAAETVSSLKIKSPADIADITKLVVLDVV